VQKHADCLNWINSVSVSDWMKRFVEAHRCDAGTSCEAGPRFMYRVSAKPEAARANEGGRIRAGGSEMTDRRFSLNSEAL
jgi:hypothetical protein